MNRQVYISESAMVHVSSTSKYQEVLYIAIDVTDPQEGEFDMERAYNRLERHKGVFANSEEGINEYWTQEALQEQDDSDFDIRLLPDKVKACYRRIIQQHIEAISEKEIQEYAAEMEVYQNQEEV